MSDDPEKSSELQKIVPMLRDLSDRVFSLSEVVARRNDADAHLAASVAKTNADLATLTALVSPLGAEIERLRTSMTTLRTDLMARMERLQDALSGIREDISVNFGANDSVRRNHDNTRENVSELTNQVATLQRQMRQLQERVREIKGDP